MRLKEYLTESILDEIDGTEEWQLFYLDMVKECKKWFSLDKKDLILYRGIRDEKRPYFKTKVEFRKSSVVYNKYFKRLNKELKKYGHVSRDKCILTTPNEKHTSFFADVTGATYVILPVGNFKYSFVKSKDFNQVNTRTKWAADKMYFAFDYPEVPEALSDDTVITGSFKFKSQEEADKFIEYQMKNNIVSNKNIKEAIKKNYEVWISCKEYYALRIDLYKQLMKNI